MNKITFEDLPSTKSPINANNLNRVQTNVENEINRVETKINNAIIYSTTEKVIGNWINGKPIYRKVVDLGDAPNNTLSTISHGISNIESIVNLYGYISDGSSYLPIPNVVASSGARLQLSANKNAIFLGSSTDRSSFKECYAIIEYTKTTD